MHDNLYIIKNNLKSTSKHLLDVQIYQVKSTDELGHNGRFKQSANLEKYLLEQNYNANDICDLVICLNEALSNGFEHGHKNHPDKEIKLILAFLPYDANLRISCMVHYQSSGFDPNQLDFRSPKEKIEDVVKRRKKGENIPFPKRGFGAYTIKQSSDVLAYSIDGKCMYFAKEIKKLNQAA